MSQLQGSVHVDSPAVQTAPQGNKPTAQQNVPARRVLVLVGIILVSLNLRAAVTSLSAIYGIIGHDINGFNTNILGVLPMLSFALFGSLTPTVSRRLGYEGALLLSMMMAGVPTWRCGQSRH